MQLNKHPILIEYYNVHRKIDSLEASVANTECCIMAGKLGESIEKLVDELAELKSQNDFLRSGAMGLGVHLDAAQKELAALRGK